MTVVYNGATGSLGAYLAGAAAERRQPALALGARLESRADLRRELDLAGPREGPVLFVQLAARVSVPDCERDPEGALRTNVRDTVATVEEVVRWADALRLDLTLVYVSSGHVYAPQPSGRLIAESDPVAPRSVYARTKLEAEEQLAALARASGRRLIVARVFGLVAPVQPPNYVLPGLIRRVAERRCEGIPGLSFVRDYLDARDVCDLLLALGAPAAPSGLYNVCSGEPVTLRELVAEIARAIDPENAAQIAARATEGPGRPDDLPWIAGDPARLSAAIGRPPRRRALRQTIEEAVREQGQRS